MPIEPTMLLTIGFLLASLIGVAVIPLVHRRAVRLTTRRLKAVLPQLTGETQADKGLLRTEFAMSTRGLENTVGRLKAKIKEQDVELRRKEDAINRLKIERDAVNIKVVALEIQAAAAARSAQIAERASLPPVTLLLPQDGGNQATQGDTWSRIECDDASTDSFARGKHTSDTSIVPAMSQSNAGDTDTWTRDATEATDQLSCGQLATALSVKITGAGADLDTSPPRRGGIPARTRKNS
jgi:hypothetical protein